MPFKPLPADILIPLNERRNRGERTAVLAREIGVTPARLQYSFVKRRLYVYRYAVVTNGGELKSRKRSPGEFWTADRLARAHEQHMAGQSLTNIATAFGVTISSLGKAMDRAGLPRRARQRVSGPAPGVEGHRGTVQPHECVTFSGVCIICDRKVA